MSARAGEWTIADLADLPDDGNRYEIVDGHLLVTPPPPLWHQSVGSCLLVQLAKACPDGWEAMYECLVAYGRTGRVPDLLVVRSESLKDRTRLAAGPGDVGLAVEIVSPSSRRRDRLDKPAEYASQGIPIMWRVELDPDVAVHPFRLQDGAWLSEPVVELQGSVPVPWGAMDLDLRRLRG